MNLNSASEEELIEALREQNLDALAELYDRLHRIALAVAHRVVGSRELAEDVVQETFLAVWRQAYMFRPERGTARSWVFSIVRHRAIDATRSRSFKQEALPLDELVVEGPYEDVSHLILRKLVS